MGIGILLIALIALPGLQLHFDTPFGTVEIVNATSKALLERAPDASADTLQMAISTAQKLTRQQPVYNEQQKEALIGRAVDAALDQAGSGEA
jgi:hypothetical protein